MNVPPINILFKENAAMKIQIRCEDCGKVKKVVETTQDLESIFNKIDSCGSDEYSIGEIITIYRGLCRECDMDHDDEFSW